MEVKVMVFKPGEPGVAKKIKPDSSGSYLRALQSEVGGYIQIIPMEGAEHLDVIVNEEGIMEGLPPNRPMWSQMLLGNIVVMRHDGEGDPTWLDADDVKTATRILDGE